MQNCAFGYSNLILIGSVSATSQVASMPASNVQSDQGSASMAWRFTDATSVLNLALTAASPMQVFSLHRTNLSSSATLRLQGYNTAVSGNAVFDTGQFPANIVNGQTVAFLSNSYTINTLHIAVTEPNMVDGYVSVPLVYAGPIWQPLRNFSSATVSGTDTGVDEVTTLSGVEFPQFRWQRRRYVIDHQSFGDAELPMLRTLARLGNASRNVLFLPDPSATTLNGDALFGRLAPSDVSNLGGTSDRHGTKLTLTERL